MAAPGWISSNDPVTDPRAQGLLRGLGVPSQWNNLLGPEDWYQKFAGTLPHPAVPTNQAPREGPLGPFPDWHQTPNWNDPGYPNYGRLTTVFPTPNRYYNAQVNPGSGRLTPWSGYGSSNVGGTEGWGYPQTIVPPQFMLADLPPREIPAFRAFLNYLSMQTPNVYSSRGSYPHGVQAGLPIQASGLLPGALQ